MAGMEPNPSAQTLGSLYRKINLLLAVLLALVSLPLIRMKSWHRWLLERQQAGTIPHLRVVLRAIGEILFALIFLLGIRMVVITGLGAQSWGEVLAAFPDFVLWIWMFASIVFVTGVIRMKLILQARRTPMGEEKRVLDAPL
jgi:hypothetical protein